MPDICWKRYFLTSNPDSNPRKASGPESYKYIAGDYYLNIETPSLELNNWKEVGSLQVYRNGLESGDKKMKIFSSGKENTVYHLRSSAFSAGFFLTPNPQYDAKATSGRESFKYIAGEYYLNF